MTCIPNRAFTRVVPYEAWSWSGRSNTRDVDDHTSFFALDGLIDPRIAAKINTFDIDVEDLLELVLRDRRRRFTGI